MSDWWRPSSLFSSTPAEPVSAPQPARAYDSVPAAYSRPSPYEPAQPAPYSYSYTPADRSAYAADSSFVSNATERASYAPAERASYAPGASYERVSYAPASERPSVLPSSDRSSFSADYRASSVVPSSYNSSSSSRGPASSSSPAASVDRPLQLLKVENGQFIVCEEAARVLESIEGKVSIISVAGLYRTGKSFALNLLLDKLGQGYGFEVGPTVKACTQGVWIWGHPVRDEEEDITYILVDSEGTGSMERDATHDSKLFALVVLISSYFIYNSVGVIDEGAINNLSLVANLSKNIQVQASSASSSSQQNLSLHTPRFLWLLRDFALDLRDMQGRPITPQQYLELALKEQDASNARVAENNRIRASIVQYFRERDCVCLVRPVVEETELRQLSTLPLSRLRPEFQQQAVSLRQKVFADARPKEHLGRAMTGRVLLGLLRQYAQAINTGAVPNITSAWQSVVEQECARARDESESLLSQLVRTKFDDQSLPLDDFALLQAFKDIRAAVMSRFSSMAVGEEQVLDSHKAQLKAQLQQHKAAVLRRNQDATRSFCTRLLNSLYEKIAEQVQAGGYGENGMERLWEDWKRVLLDYDKSSRGDGAVRLAVLTEFISPKAVEGCASIVSQVRVGLASKMQEVEVEKARAQEKARAAEASMQGQRERETQLADQVTKLEGDLLQARREQTDLIRKLELADITGQQAKHNLNMRDIELSNLQKGGNAKTSNQANNSGDKVKSSCKCVVM